VTWRRDVIYSLLVILDIGEKKLTDTNLNYTANPKVPKFM